MTVENVEPAQPLNGHDMSAPPTIEDQVFAAYEQFSTQLGALLTLLAGMPIEPLLAACKRKQRSSILTLPASVTAEQMQMRALGLRNDEKIITAALNLQRAYVAAMSGQAVS